MKKNFLVIFLIFVVSVSVFCFLKYGQKKFEEYSFLKNKNHEYVLAVLQSSADNKKKNYLSDFYFDKKNKTMSVEEYNNFLHRDKRINSITRADIYYILGNVYLKKKDYANACYCYKKAFYFAPYNTEIKYDIKKFINFTDKILVPEKLLENNYAKSVEQLKIFIKNKLVDISD